jgi:hypothetical protein
MKPTLVFIRSFNLGDRLFRHGDELPPGVLGQDDIDKLLDSGRLAEHAERLSLYRLFPSFSGCSESERERLSDDELAACALES